MYTRKQYMNKECSHADYNRQFVSPAMLRSVESHIGVERIRASTDEHLNDIPLWEWDLLPYNTSRELLKECGDYLTQAGHVCIAKQAARMLLEGEK